MPFSIVIKDVSEMEVDAVVNSTNRYMRSGGHGVDYSIHKAAGPELQKECSRLAPCEVSEVKITSGYNIPCKMIIHTVGPHWDGRQESIDLLRKCYENVLKAAVDNGCRSIAIPLISSGYHRFPKGIVLNTATEVSKSFLEKEDLDIYLNVFSRTQFEPTIKFLPKNWNFNQDGSANAVNVNNLCSDEPVCYSDSAPDEISMHVHYQKKLIHPSRKAKLDIETSYCQRESYGDIRFYRADSESKRIVSDDLDLDESFGQLVTRLAEKYFDKTSQFYVAANITKSVFSKMKNQPEYNPSRSTALACAVVLAGKGVDANKLLYHAGMILTRLNKRDCIVMEALDNHIYDVFKINEVLFDNDQPLLGYT